VGDTVNAFKGSLNRRVTNGKDELELHQAEEEMVQLRPNQEYEDFKDIEHPGTHDLFQQDSFLQPETPLQQFGRDRSQVLNQNRASLLREQIPLDSRSIGQASLGNANNKKLEITKSSRA
jgi:hypothetical protein